MKTKILLFFILLSSICVFSQDGKMREKIKSQKIAFITEKLALTPTEAQGFWPIYNKYEDQAQQIKNKELRSIKTEIRKSKGNLSEEKADKLLNRLITAENDLHEARTKLVTELKTVISSEKIIKLKASEDEFNRMLLEKLREIRKKRQGIKD